MLFIELVMHLRFAFDDDDDADVDGIVAGAVDITMYDSFASKPFNLLFFSGNAADAIVDVITFLLPFSVCT